MRRAMGLETVTQCFVARPIVFTMGAKGSLLEKTESYAGKITTY